MTSILPSVSVLMMMIVIGMIIVSSSSAFIPLKQSIMISSISKTIHTTVVSSSSSSSLNLFNFLNEGKNALVRNMAGEYDQVAVRIYIAYLFYNVCVFQFFFMQMLH
jgi:hypothetical protein